MIRRSRDEVRRIPQRKNGRENRWTCPLSKEAPKRPPQGNGSCRHRESTRRGHSKRLAVILPPCTSVTLAPSAWSGFDTCSPRRLKNVSVLDVPVAFRCSRQY